ncbi:hypothetical protein Fmac_009946 [Flemingia macrophylla]|uniref:Protein kinase domain-containing protein n=1 Tax=Flemingia macrophylla TaxID=520843 RepID=A0ABD1N1P6_9FABA
MTGYGAESDMYCMQTIKKLDPFGHLSSWNLESNTEGEICRFNGVECWNLVEDRIIGLLLSNMELKGQFPRCVENFTWLQTLDLSHNELFGYIPSDISTKLPDLTSLDLSSNNFYGEIPKGIANLSGLVTLKLDGNQLTGQIPQELGLLPRLRDFSVANNLLEGTVPVIVSNVNVSLSYANNSGLCGGSVLESCDKNMFGRSFWYSFTIGFVSSVVAFMYYYAPWNEYKKRRSNAIHPLRNNQKIQNHQKNARKETEWLPQAMQVQKSKERLYDGEKYKREFLLETMIPGRQRHRNIAPLLGFCIEKNERILVYKYMSNGRLSDWLHFDEEHQTVKLEWPVRIHIALGLARGLSWLHNRCKIIHLNLESECVLLDKNFEPKISNFGKAKFQYQTVEDRVRMKLFLIDGLGIKGSVERDVYDFGIILFELITGKRLSPMANSSDSVNGHLMNCISKSLFTDPVDFYGAIDQYMIGKGYDDKILRLLEVACDCVKASTKQRPKMVDVHKSVRAMWEGYKPWFGSERLELSMGCHDDQIKCTSEIEIEYIF